MTNDINRRDALKLVAGTAAGILFAPGAACARSAASDAGTSTAGTATAASAAQQAQPAIITKAIPSSGERLPVIGIGTARRYEAVTPEHVEVMRNLPKLGGRLVDTAPSYGNAETVVGELIAQAGNRDQLFLATKVGRGGQGAEAGIAEMEQGFRRLKTTKIDLMQIHNLGGVPTMLPILREWKKAGRIRYYGVTTSSDQQYAQLETILNSEPMDFVQIDYAIDNRNAEERILPLARDKGVAVLVNLPFGRGRVFEKFGQQPVPDWAKEIGIQTWAQFALKYLVSHPAVTVAIPGTATMAYLADNIGAARGSLPDETLRKRMAAMVDG
jgi:aryl-alcohol dehydrogenase-like predicted oxidoreductase